METYATDIRLETTGDKTKIILTLPISKREGEISVEGLLRILESQKLLSVKIDEYKQRRSLDANAYCWVLCQKIAEVINSTKELVYRKVIRDVGQFDTLLIHEEAAESFTQVWSSKGIGWFAESEGTMVINQTECSRLIAYRGSSTYNTKEMTVLINELINTCNELGIETRPDYEVEAMLKSWQQ